MNYVGVSNDLWSRIDRKVVYTWLAFLQLMLQNMVLTASGSKQEYTNNDTRIY